MNRLQLRPFQQDCYNILFNDIMTWSGGDRRSAIVIPTGGGKTIICSMLALTLWREHGLRSIVVTHQKIIARQWEQTLARLSAQYEAESAIMIRRSNTVGPPSVLIASVRRELPREVTQHYQLLIFDEAHHATANTWEPWFERFPNAYKLGATATPIRGDGTCITRVFGKIVYLIELRELINRGILPEARGWRIRTGVDLSTVPIIGGDYHQSALGRKVNTPARNAIVLEAYQRWGQGKPALIFAVDQTHADELAACFTQAGYPCRAVHSGLSDAEVDTTLDDFKNGRLHLLTSCRKLLEGYDVPRAEVAILARPFTQVSAKVDLVQAVGRALRRAPGKLYALILELVDDNHRSRPGTVAELFELPHDYDPQGASLAVAGNQFENQTRQNRIRAMIDSVEAELRRRHQLQSSYTVPRLSESVESFDVVRYIENAMGLPCISDGQHLYIALVDGSSVLIDQVTEGLFRVTYRSRQGRPNTLTIAETVDQALAVAEQRLRQICDSSVLDASRLNAPWRHNPHLPATPAQLEAIRRLADLEERLLHYLNRGEASDLLTSLIANQIFHHRPSNRSAR